MIMDKMQEEFHEFCIKYGFSIYRNEHGWYPPETGKIFNAWKAAWQASRDALVVELPATCCRTLIFELENSLEVGMEHGEYYEPDAIHEAISNVGIRYE